MELKIKCGEIELCANAMEQFESRLPHLYMRMGEMYVRMVRDSSRKEQSPGGEKWKPLSPITAEQEISKGKKRGYHPILRVTGRMLDIYPTVLSNGVSIGTNAPYAPLQQFGGLSKDGRRVPARPWLFDAGGGVPERFKEMLMNMVKAEMEKCLQ